ncbi:uncharacterized protein LOC116767456 [Danaus plexippus]|uniref:uncharacterized protein LOC116767456 n=1 Tax=Danaus plexippus TaxID=13037 RepID=UPI002AB2A35F|nr:uncharacterized protein LOC116767456 [Danaus plexippus]XP_032513673.2 uncharacterized protein LOC116767456 [Danaus plexippus]
MYFKMHYHNKTCLKIILLAALLFVLYTIYYKMTTYQDLLMDEINLQQNLVYKYDASDYLIYTPGCSIPYYSKTYNIKEPEDLKKSCGTRTVFVKKKTESIIIFTINKDDMNCCYQFVSPSITNHKIDVRKLRYSICTPFKNGTETQLEEEVVLVTCKPIKSPNRRKNKYGSIYKDAYAFVKKYNRSTEIISDHKKWNILILGMDTMSRARFYTSMPKTAKYFKKHKWLDFSGYQKVGYNTFPNIMALLTGKNMSTVYKTCSSGMDHCNDMIIWSNFKKAGYITATGEDNLRLPDTFSKYGYVSAPTDHYLRPLFLTGEDITGNLVCTKKLSSVKHILDYAIDFVVSYSNQKSFGMFWTNSYSHNLNNIPSLIDEDIVNSFQKMYKSGILSNTFIFFLSDHGIRYGNSRIPHESYYEERLPMLFVRVPEEFRKKYVKEYMNMQINHNRMVTPYDLYLTFWNILENSTTHKIVDTCPGCLSIFNEISPYRTCADAGVHDKWCTCHKLNPINKKDSDITRSIKLTEDYLHNVIKRIDTIDCYICESLKIKSVLRTHTYNDEIRNNTYYVVAFTTTPGDVGYEAVILKHKGEFTVFPIETITAYNTRGNCVKNPNTRAFCVCKKSC